MNHLRQNFLPDSLRKLPQKSQDNVVLAFYNKCTSLCGRKINSKESGISYPMCRKALVCYIEAIINAVKNLSGRIEGNYSKGMMACDAQINYFDPD